MRNGITHENLGVPYKEITAEQIKKLEEVFVCFDFACNLSCPHCTLRLIPQHRQLDKVKETLNYIRNISPNLTLNFFGGEPLLLKDEELSLFEEFFPGKKVIISTNLLNLSPYKLKLLRQTEDVNTSWNPKRFTPEQENIFREHLIMLQVAEAEYSIMITLTKDLIEEFTPEAFIELIKEFKPRNLDLKMMIGDYSLNFEEVDNWLCKLYDAWKKDNIPTKNLLFYELERILKNNRKWKDYCEKVATVMPDGNIKIGCPYFEYKTSKDFCYACEYYPVCEGGCNIQEKCTFPKKLFEKVKKDYEKA